jgi:hypothetical protein
LVRLVIAEIFVDVKIPTRVIVLMIRGPYSELLLR